MRNKKAGYALGVVESAAAFQVWSIWLAPFRVAGSVNSWQTSYLLLGAFGLLLVILPLTGLLGVHRDKRWGFLLFATFPLVSIIYGVTALPLVAYFFGKDSMLNSLLIGVINALVCALGFWYFVSSRPGYDEPVKQQLVSPEE